MGHTRPTGHGFHLIERFFGPFLLRALPELYVDADLSQEPRFLDKEFRDILQTSDLELHQSVAMPVSTDSSSVAVRHQTAAVSSSKTELRAP